MTEANFYKSFNFNFYKFNKYHLNDQTNSECPLHYFGCIINGKGKITAQAYGNVGDNGVDIISEDKGSYIVRAVAYNATDLMLNQSIRRKTPTIM